MRDNVPIQLSLPKATYLALKRIAQKSQRAEADIVLDALRAYLEHLAKVDSFLGMFADDPEMVDHLVSQIMLARETTPLRLE